MTIHLEPEQEELFTTLRDAVQTRPRERREEFMFLRSFQADHIQGNGVDLHVLYEDVVALDDAGLIRVTTHHKRGSGFNFVLPPSASALFDEYKTGKTVPATATEPVAPHETQSTRADPKAVMVVHGRNEHARQAMFEFLRRLGLKPLEWGDLIAGTGKAAPYVGEVLDYAFAAARAVVVLFTPDDEARLRDEFQYPDDESHETDLTPQARPNVLFEAGMALARHPTRTVLVELGRLRPISDLYGRHVVRLNGTEARLRDIAKRLEEAGCGVAPAADAWADPDQFPPASTSSPVSQSSHAPSSAAVAREVGYLNEDARRWIEDRDRELTRQSRQRSGEMNARGLTHSGAHLAGLAILRQQALLEYRDEMSRKRRRYAQLLDDVPASADVPRFAPSETSLEILARWREPVTVSGMADQAVVDDPTDHSREPDLRRFEGEGDGPG